MNRIKTFLLCLVLLALAGILHHEWQQMSGSSGIVTPASAASLSNGSAQTCNGTGTWHFVNPQNGGDCEPLTVTFNCGGTTVTDTISAFACLNNTTNYQTIQTSGDCMLVSASNTAPGKVVLSSLVCTAATPTPTPTPG